MKQLMKTTTILRNISNKKPIVALIIFSSSFLVWLFLFNRNTPKLGEVFPIFITSSIALIFLILRKYKIMKNKNGELCSILLTILGIILTITISIISNSERTVKHFTHKFFITSDGKETLNFMRDPILREAYKYHSRLNTWSFNTNLLLNFNEMSNNTEHVAYSLILFLMDKYHSRRDIDSSEKNAFTVVGLKNFPTNIVTNKYFKNLEYFSPFKQLALPQGTKIAAYHINNLDYKIIFKKYNVLYNKDFEINITIRFTSSFPGLDELNSYFGLERPGVRYFDSGNKNLLMYKTLSSDISIEVEYDRWLRPWSDSSIKYKKWIQYFINDIEEQFSWKIQYNKLKDYMIITVLEKGMQ